MSGRAGAVASQNLLRLLRGVALATLLVVPAMAQDAVELARPDSIMTPGAVDTPQAVFCSRPSRERRHLPKGLSCRIAEA